MPRVTESYREARRDEIARAAVRCIVRTGLSEATIADIVRESGLSAGAIYSNFTNKAELARYVLTHVLGARRLEIEAAGERGEVRPPTELLRRMVSSFPEHGIPFALPLQFWAAATVDADLRTELDHTIESIRTTLTIAARPWTDATGDDLDTVVTGIMALAQGYIMSVNVMGPVELDTYLARVSGVLES